jgi:hypothetical protein
MDKKNEDVGGVAQIDKTSVFQEGRLVYSVAGSCWWFSVVVEADMDAQPEYSVQALYRRGNAEWYVVQSGVHV